MHNVHLCLLQNETIISKASSLPTCESGRKGKRGGNADSRAVPEGPRRHRNINDDAKALDKRRYSFP
ncbi:hypothetical protein KM043_013303 [Ampulex compressa]|nr:hypothetical protein KM043_013303 [Ampulex compressa]